VLHEVFVCSKASEQLVYEQLYRRACHHVVGICGCYMLPPLSVLSGAFLCDRGCRISSVAGSVRYILYDTP
jgi:hypothetical protein